MINLKYFRKKIKDVRIKDYCALFPMIIAKMVSPLFKRKYKDTWIICENENEARDNGYHFFKYLSINQPQQKCFYIISKKAKDYNKVKKLGQVITYGSVKHWILYYTAQYNISSQKGGKPNAAWCSFFELIGIFNPHNIFLQHGVIMNKCDWLMADRCCFDGFITSTNSEYQFVQDTFGYANKTVQLTGLPRFDNLHCNNVKSNRIIIMPTWRKWLKLKSERNNMLEDGIKSSEFMINWMELLNSKELQKIIEQYDLDIIFYPHREMQQYISEFKINNRVSIADLDKVDIQELMKSAAIMITDYSSVCWDMIYMKKPIIFYQFDEKKFREYHYEKGWFNYNNNSFGKSFANYKEVIIELECIIKKQCSISDEYLEAHQREFVFYDNKNSERIYKWLREES